MKIKPLDVLALFLAIPALVGVIDLWLYVFFGKAVLVSWDVNNVFAACCLASAGFLLYTISTDANR